MFRFLAAAIVALLPLLAAGCSRAPGDEQTLVDRATLTVQEMMNQTVSDDPRSMLRRAKGVMVCPRIFKAGFMVGGEGGACVLLARAGNGTWSYPAFYGLGSGSFGLQIGVEDSQLMMMIMTDKGLSALMDSQVKLGANASVAVATVGGSVQGSTTAAVGADIVAFASSRGLFGGIALEGSVMSSRSEWNQGYYGQPFGARQIVIQMQGVNRGADPLREILTRYGAGSAPAAMAPTQSPPPVDQQGRGYAPAYPPARSVQPAPYGAPAQQQDFGAPMGGRPPVQEQTLSAPRR